MDEPNVRVHACGLIAVLFFFTVYSGIKEVDQRLVDRVRTLGGGRAVLLREVYLPAVTAWALSQLKVAVGIGGRHRIGTDLANTPPGLC